MINIKPEKCDKTTKQGQGQVYFELKVINIKPEKCDKTTNKGNKNDTKLGMVIGHISFLKVTFLSSAPLRSVAG